VQLKTSGDSKELIKYTKMDLNGTYIKDCGSDSLKKKVENMIIACSKAHVSVK